MPPISKKERALVTGGAGLIGSHVVDLLLAQGWSVRVLDSLEPQTHREGEPPWLQAAVQNGVHADFFQKRESNFHLPWLAVHSHSSNNAQSYRQPRAVASIQVTEICVICVICGS